MRWSRLGMATVVVLGAVAACGRRPETAPTSFAARRIEDLSCRAPDGGLGVELDAVCRAIAVHAGGGDAAALVPAPDPRAAAAAARVTADGCRPQSEVALGDGAAFVAAACGTAPHTVPSYLVRVGPDGAVTRVAIPWSNGFRVSFVPAARPLVVAVVNSVGTVAFDARTLAARGRWERLGGWFNAHTTGAVASPDGAWFAVPDPYGLRVDFVRTRDLAVAGSIDVHAAIRRGEGPGRLAWSEAGLELTTYPLPYE